MMNCVISWEQPLNQPAQVPPASNCIYAPAAFNQIRLSLSQFIYYFPILFRFVSFRFVLFCFVLFCFVQGPEDSLPDLILC